MKLQRDIVKELEAKANDLWDADADEGTCIDADAAWNEAALECHELRKEKEAEFWAMNPAPEEMESAFINAGDTLTEVYGFPVEGEDPKKHVEYWKAAIASLDNIRDFA